jgi:hypothetical protein
MGRCRYCGHLKQLTAAAYGVVSDNGHANISAVSNKGELKA